MNKIKIYINTYKNEDLLKNNIDSLLTSDVVNYNHEIMNKVGKWYYKNNQKMSSAGRMNLY